MNLLFPEIEESEIKDPQQETIIKPQDQRYKTLGQFFTPPEVASLMAEIASTVFENSEENRPVKILDPAAGEGALLAPLSEKPWAATYGIEIDPQHRKALATNAHFYFIGDGIAVLSQLLELAKTQPNEDFPVDLFLMNPPYNLQMTVPEELSSLLCVRRDFKTNRYTAVSHELFLEAAVRVIAALRERTFSYRPPVLLSLHSEHHLRFIKKLQAFFAEKYEYINFLVLHIGKAYPELNYNFFILYVHPSRAYYREQPPRELFETENRKEFFSQIRRTVFSQYDIALNERSGEKPLTEKIAALYKNILSLEDLDIELKREDILPQINVKGKNVSTTNPQLLEYLSLQTEIQHPLTDEKITIPEALLTTIGADIILNPIVQAFLQVPPEQFPTHAGLVSLSPITPLQYLAFLTPGIYRAQKSLADSEGNEIIKKGEEYYIKTEIVQREHSKNYTEYRTDESGEEKEVDVKKTYKYQSKILRVFSRDRKNLILEVEV